GLKYEAAIDEIRSVVSISFDLQREDPMMQTSVSGKAPMIASESGHLFIKPRVNGSEPGWFAFDTGAAVTIISRELAATAAPAVVGTRNLAGAGAKVLIGNLRRMARFEVGPLIIENLLCMEAPDAGILLQFAALLDEPVVGIVGWHVLIRTIAELDFAQSTLILHDPSSYQLEGGVWQRLALHHKHPFLRGRLEGDHEGWFCIDSGAGKIPLMIHSSAVQRWDLLRGRETEDAMAAGVGGAVRFRIGTLKWVEVADQRFEQPVVLFAEQESGALSDDYTDGTLGSAFFENRILILDYAGSRFALLPKSPD
ncbi:MAG TPA: pepsin/retropepsin-like aspartic protease family protein, partial [Acidobacteriota bacterium]